MALHGCWDFQNLRAAVNDALRGAASLTVLGTPTTADLLVHKPSQYALLIGDGTRLNKCDLDGGEIAIFPAWQIALALSWCIPVSQAGPSPLGSSGWNLAPLYEDQAAGLRLGAGCEIIGLLTINSGSGQQNLPRKSRFPRRAPIC